MRVCLCCEFYVVCVIDVRVSVLKGCDFIFGYKPPARFQMFISHRCVVAS